MKIWLLSMATGEYSGYDVTPLCYFLTEAEAEEAANKLRAKDPSGWSASYYVEAIENGTLTTSWLEKL